MQRPSVDEMVDGEPLSGRGGGTSIGQLRAPSWRVGDQVASWPRSDRTTCMYFSSTVSGEIDDFQRATETCCDPEQVQAWSRTFQTWMEGLESTMEYRQAAEAQMLADEGGIALAPGLAKYTTDRLAQQPSLVKERRKAREEVASAKAKPQK